MRDDDERWLYQRIGRAKLAPQGIGVLNSAGQVLAWVQMFDDDPSVLDFLERALKRFKENADARQPVVTERYMKFPGSRVADNRDETKLPAVISAGHAKGTTCPAEDGKGKVAPGSMVAHLVGRALDGKGQPMPDVVKQEHYVEDKFAVPPAMIKDLSQVLAGAGTERVRLPDEFARLCAGHAHLGHIDVQPCLFMVKGQAENKGEWKRCELWARQVPTGKETTLWQIDGQSEVVSAVAINGKGVHNVKLGWEGYIEAKDGHAFRFALSARGTEKLQFAKDDHPLKKIDADEVAFLPAGRPIDVEGGVRYGIVGVVPANAEVEPPAAAQVPDEARKQLIEVLGGPFIGYRDRVHDELKLSDEQRQKILDTISDHVQETMRVFDRIMDLKPQEREKLMEEHRRKSGDKLSALLKDVLEAKQRDRLFQLQVQQAGAFALLGRNEAFEKLKITDEQRKQFMTVVHEMHQKIEALVKDIPPGSDPAKIMAKVQELRRAHSARIEGLLNPAQKEAWREVLGAPFDLGD